MAQTEVILYGLKIALFTAALSSVSFPLAIKLGWHIRNWNLGKEIGWNLGHFLLIGTFNFMLTRTYDSLEPISWMYMVIATTLVGIIPVTADILWRLRQPNSSSNVEEVIGQASNIVFVKSSGNYLEISSVIDGDVEKTAG